MSAEKQRPEQSEYESSRRYVEDDGYTMSVAWVVAEKSGKLRRQIHDVDADEASDDHNECHFPKREHAVFQRRKYDECQYRGRHTNDDRCTNSLVRVIAKNSGE
ncbi:unnamed protein product [marine sediment metagenome]|uniref:Uncharacterized protein n=1 Tax=marine sediment metagenome TaxID=412755 RepID=X0W2A5_9ZZZZ